jgi:hypothetical protein
MRVAGLLPALLAAVCLAAPAGAATKNGITPLAPKAGAQIGVGTAPTFRARVKGAGQVWVYVCRSARKSVDGTICHKLEIGRATKRKNGTYAYKPKLYDYDGFWLRTPGTYYWQADRIASAGGKDVHQEGPVVKFRVV